MVSEGELQKKPKIKFLELKEEITVFKFDSESDSNSDSDNDFNIPFNNVKEESDIDELSKYPILRILNNRNKANKSTLM